MKKNLWRIVAMLLVMVTLTTCVLSTTFAKYVTSSGTFTETARVAKWGVTLTTNITGLFTDKYDVVQQDDVISINGADVVAPGTSNSLTINSNIEGTPEVACEFATTANITLSNWEIDGVFYCPLVFTINGETVSGTQFCRAEDFERWIEYKISKLPVQFVPNTALESTIEEVSISWSWPYEDDGNATNGYVDDTLDTCLGIRSGDGNEANDPSIKIELSQTIEQSLDEDLVIQFGSYPQSEVTDTTLKATLTDAAGGTAALTDGVETSGKWQSYNYYMNGEVKDYMWYADVELDGEKYRGVYFIDYRRDKIVSDNKSCQDDNGYGLSTVYWFKYEPLEWIVLSKNVDDGTMYVTSKYSIDAQHFAAESNNYAESDIRAWLNGTFFNTAFSAENQRKIANTKVDGSTVEVVGSSNADVSEDLLNKIFLASVDDVKNNGNFKFSENADRQIKVTAYAKSQNAYVNNNSDNFGMRLLRTPKTSSTDLVSYTNLEGALKEGSIVTFTRWGIVPMMNIRLYEAPHTRVDVAVNDAEPTVATFAMRRTAAVAESTPDHKCDTCGAKTSNCSYDGAACTFGGCEKALYIHNDTNGDGKFDAFEQIIFGSYPQSEVGRDSELANQLTKLVGADDVNNIPTAEDPNGWTSYQYYLAGEKTDYMWYIDVDFDGDGRHDYRGVFFSQYRYNHIDDTGTNTLQDNYGYHPGNIYWFMYEPMTWSILKENNGIVLLLSSIIVDVHEYDDDSSNYELSTIRAWLNSAFYDTAFSSLEKQMIPTTYVDNGEESVGGKNSNICPNTNDNVFLLSKDEVTNYMKGHPNFSGTYYACAQGLTSYWWLRTPSEKTTARRRNFNDFTTDHAVPVGNVYSILPALNLNLNADVHYCSDVHVDHTCDVCGEKVSEHVYDGARCTICGDTLYTVQDSDGNGTIDTVTLGSYPQSQVDKDSVLASNLTRMAGKLPTAENSQRWTSYKYYVNGEKADYMWYQDITYGGERYRGVYYTALRPDKTAKWTSTKYYQSTNNVYGTSSTVYWFKYEPIKWRVLSNDATTGSSFVVCDMVLDAQAFYTDTADRTINNVNIHENNYEYSTIRTWLNATFYETAFDNFQRQLVMTTNVDNSQGTTNSAPAKYCSNNTNDKVFLLSYADANSMTKANRQRQATAYARSQGTRHDTDGIKDTYWMLRSPNQKGATDDNSVEHSTVSYIKNEGTLYGGTGAFVVNSYLGVVPAMNIKLPQ